MSYYNVRDSLGKFTKRVYHHRKPVYPTIVAGRLYGYRGSVVRACRKCSNGKRHVSFHKQLHGFVAENELELIGQVEVSSYLNKALSR
jgi:hypothetical protein